MPTAAIRPLRTHQAQLLAVAQAIATGADLRDILAAVTPGGGKSLLPVLAAHALIGAGIVEQVVWVVPRDSLRLQAEEAFADRHWREVLGHRLGVRAAGLGPRGLGKLLVVAPDQTQARRHLDQLRSWVPRAQADSVRLATSDEQDAHETLAAYRLRPEPSALVTVAMAYEGLDAPRSPWWRR